MKFTKKLLSTIFFRRKFIDQKAIAIVINFLNDLLDKNETNCFEEFIRNRDKFLKSLGDSNIIKYIGSDQLYKQDKNGIQNISKSNNLEKHENIISFFHIFSMKDLGFKEISELLDGVKENKNEKYSKDLSDFTKKYIKEVMGINKDKDAKLTKLHQLQRIIRILGDEYKEFSEKYIEKFFDNIEKISEEGFNSKSLNLNLISEYSKNSKIVR